MMLRQIRYGINLGLVTVHIAPWGVDQYVYNVGNIHISYSAEAIAFSLPGDSSRKFVWKGLKPSTTFTFEGKGCIMTPATATSTSDGVLSFVGPLGCSVTAKAK